MWIRLYTNILAEIGRQPYVLTSDFAVDFVAIAYCCNTQHDSKLGLCNIDSLLVQHKATGADSMESR